MTVTLGNPTCVECCTGYDGSSCPYCVLRPRRWRVDINFTNDPSVPTQPCLTRFNGSYYLCHDGGCSWSGPVNTLLLTPTLLPDHDQICFFSLHLFVASAPVCGIVADRIVLEMSFSVRSDPFTLGCGNGFYAPHVIYFTHVWDAAAPLDRDCTVAQTVTLATCSRTPDLFCGIPAVGNTMLLTPLNDSSSCPPLGCTQDNVCAGAVLPDQLCLTLTHLKCNNNGLMGQESHQGVLNRRHGGNYCEWAGILYWRNGRPIAARLTLDAGGHFTLRLATLRCCGAATGGVYDTEHTEFGGTVSYSFRCSPFRIEWDEAVLLDLAGAVCDSLRVKAYVTRYPCSGIGAIETDTES